MGIGAKESGPASGVVRYSDDLDRWRGPGDNELRKHLKRAFEQGQTVRAVVSKADDTSSIDEGADAKNAKKTFSVKENWAGKVVKYDGRYFVIDFRQR